MFEESEESEEDCILNHFGVYLKHCESTILQLKIFLIKKMTLGTSLIAQWLRPHAPNAGGLGLVPGQRTGSHMAQLKILYAAISKQLRPASAK